MNKFIVTIRRKDQSISKVVNKDTFTIGRSSDCDIPLNDSLVSRVHLTFTHQDREVWVEDKNSSNGTFVNGTRIAQGVALAVSPSDKIQLGKSEYSLSVELEVLPLPEVPKASLPTTPPTKEEPPVADTIAMAPPKKLNPIPTMSTPSSPVIDDAKKKAAQIIMEGEVQAEKRVQSIYQKAQQTKEEADKYHESRLAEAKHEADAILAEAQKSGRELIHEAREMAQKVREEVDGFVLEFKKKAQDECDLKLAQAFSEARQKTDEEHDLKIQKAREEADRLIHEAQQKARDLEEQSAQVQAQLSDFESQLAKRRSEFDEVLKSHQKEASIVEEHIHALKDKEASISAFIERQTHQREKLEDEQDQLKAEKEKLERLMAELKEKQASLSASVHSLENKNAQLTKEFESQKAHLEDKFEKEKISLAKAEEDRIEELRLQHSQRMQKMERELLESVLRRKDSLVREIFTSVEREVIKDVGGNKWESLGPMVQGAIQGSLESQVLDINATPSNEKPLDLVKKRRVEMWRNLVSGAVAGVLILVGVQAAIKRVNEEQAPMAAMAKAEAQKIKADLEKRKFNPPKKDELKASYVDAVIYTNNFVETYTDNEFQKRFYKAASKYLLKTWRVDEDQSLQLLSATQALVKELQDRKERIHPDFVKEGLGKMGDLEKESMKRFAKLLGSSVRVESFRRFERQFYQEEAQRRRTASQN